MHVKLNYVHSDRTTVKRRRVGLWRINLLCRTCVAATRGRQWRVESSFGSRRRSLIRITTASFTSNCSARSVRNANRTLSNTPCGTLRKLLRYVQQSVLQSFFQMHDLFFFQFWYQISPPFPCSVRSCNIVWACSCTSFDFSSVTASNRPTELQSRCGALYCNNCLQVVYNLYIRVGQLFYGFAPSDYYTQRRTGKPRQPHRSELCQACANNICREVSAKAAVSRSSSRATSSSAAESTNSSCDV